MKETFIISRFIKIIIFCFSITFLISFMFSNSLIFAQHTTNIIEENQNNNENVDALKLLLGDIGAGAPTIVDEELLAEEVKIIPDLITVKQDDKDNLISKSSEKEEQANEDFQKGAESEKTEPFKKINTFSLVNFETNIQEISKIFAILKSEQINNNPNLHSQSPYHSLFDNFVTFFSKAINQFNKNKLFKNSELDSSEADIKPQVVNIEIPPPPWLKDTKLSENKFDATKVIDSNKNPNLDYDLPLGNWRELDIGELESPLTKRETNLINTDLMDNSDNEHQKLKNLFSDLFSDDDNKSDLMPTDTVSQKNLKEKKDGISEQVVTSKEKQYIYGNAKIISLGEKSLTLNKITENDASKKEQELRNDSPKDNFQHPNNPKENTDKIKITPIKKITPKSSKQKISSQKPSLILINESGDPKATQSYRRVLESMGYEIISVHEKPQQKGATFISYRSGEKTKAQDLAQRLPGRKITLEAQKEDCLPTEISLYIR